MEYYRTDSFTFDYEPNGFFCFFFTYEFLKNALKFKFNLGIRDD